MMNIPRMIPDHLHSLFWDISLGTFDPLEYPAYTILRILELGDDAAVTWLRETFSESQIAQVIRSERRLSRKSASFWALVYHIPESEVAALAVPA
jgi:hypothetical protein